MDLSSRRNMLATTAAASGLLAAADAGPQTPGMLQPSRTPGIGGTDALTPR